MRKSDVDSVESGIRAADDVPGDIVEAVLDSALNPLLDAAAASRNPEKALLAVTVCDPACGSGQFLVAAARRIAARVSAAREGSPSADAVRRALADVLDNCVYGVDLSEAAAERTRDRLRRECAVPGKALDEHVRQGNSLIGTVPGLIDGGIPDSAFQPLDGDDPKFARSVRRSNTRPAPGQVTLFTDTRPSQAGRLRRLVADAWCAAFAWAKRPDAPPVIINRSLTDLRERGPVGVLPDTLKEIERLRREHRFFHWHLEFPEIFRRGGFSCVIGDPPRGVVDRTGARAAFAFARGSGAYPECAEGLAVRGVTTLRADLLFTERAASIIARGGRAGWVVPSGIAASAGGRHLLARLTGRGAVESLYDFGSHVDPFCLLTVLGEGARTDAARYGFGLSRVAEIGEPERTYSLRADEIALINPNTRALPAFRGRREAALVTEIYRRVPVLLDETRPDGNPWKMRLAPAFFRLRNDSGLLSAEERDPADLPVYEAAMAHLFDHRCAPPRHWVSGEEVAGRLAELGWRWDWLCGWRGTCPPEDERAAVAAFLPRAAVTESFPLMLPRAVPPFVAGLIAAQSSLVFDFVARRKLGGGARMRPAIWQQLPVPTPRMLEPHLPFIVPRVLELVCTAPDMAPLARDLDDGGVPFAWDEGRRAELRAELDAFFLRLYGIDDRDDAAWILGSFPSEPGGMILRCFDRMASAEADGSPYETRIVPFPGHGPRTARPMA